MKQIRLGLVLIVLVFILVACGTTDSNKTNPNENDQNQEMDSSSEENMEAEHSGSGEVPESLKATTNPTYEVGSKAIIKTDHMKGMDGAEAKIVGAYDTRAYVISYTPTTGGEKVKDHKWVIQEEIENAGDGKLDPGTEATIEANHMKGMDGAKAKIESSEETTVYMIDYVPTTGEKEVKNHKWVTGDELEGK